MRLKLLIGLFVLSLFLISGCTKEVILQCPECEECPPAEECPVVECPELDCSACPPSVETETVNVTTYVCSDRSLVEDPADCFKEVTYDFVPITTNEEGTYVEEVKLATACVKARQGGSVYFKVGSVPEEINFQVKDSPDKPYTTLYTSAGLFANYNYFAICKSCTGYGEFQLQPGKVYLFRMSFDYGKGDVQYSNEHIIDTRDGSDYMTKKC